MFFKLVLILAAGMLLIMPLSVNAVPSAPPSTGISDEQLSATEQKLLQKTYNNDPLAKRLQRLELTLFGATQSGSDEQRWQHIKHCLNNTGKTNKNISSSLNELEKYIFKGKPTPQAGKTTSQAGKTTSQATALQRLNRLETKVFGKPTPSMPTAYRIERLQRTLGITGTSGGIAELPGTLPAPMRGMPPGMEMPPGMPMFGFGNNFGFGDNGMGDPDFSSQMSQLFREMQEMQRMQPFGFDQDPNQNPNYEEHRFYMYSTPDGGFKFGQEPDPNFNPNNRKPDNGKNKKLKPNAPAPAPQLIPQPRTPDERIPSYADPNFI